MDASSGIYCMPAYEKRNGTATEETAPKWHQIDIKKVPKWHRNH